MSRIYNFKKVDSKEEFDKMVYCTKSYIWSGDSKLAEMRFANGTCYYYLFVKGDKMQKLTKKLVRDYVVNEENCLFATQVSKGKKSRF